MMSAKVLRPLVFLLSLLGYPGYPGGAIFAAEKPEILEANLSYTPRLGGHFRSGNSVSFFMMGDRNITVLNPKFEVTGFLSPGAGVSVIDFADMNGDGYDDLLELRRTEILARYQRPGMVFENPVRLVSGYFVSPPGIQKIEQFEIAHDVNHDGYSEIVAPSDLAYEFYLNVQGRMIRQGTLDCPYESSYSDRYWSNSDIRANRIVAKTTIPSAIFRDLNGDGIDDMFCRFKTMVHYHLSSRDPAGNPVLLGVRQVRSYPVDLSREYASGFRIEDMDFDGSLDAVFSVVSGLGIKVKTDIYVFWGKGGLPDPAGHFHASEAGGVFTPLFLENGGKKQLLMASLRIGVPFFISYIIDKKIKLNGNVYGFGGDRKMEKLAVHQISFPVIDNYYPGFTVGDFNRDGYSDVAISNDPMEIVIHYGSKDMSGSNRLLIPLMGYGIMKTVNFPDGNDGILIYLPQKVLDFNPRKIYLLKFK